MKWRVRPSAPASESGAGPRGTSPRASWSRFSPKCRTPRSCSSRTSEAGKYFVTTTRVTSSGSRPASAQPRSMRSLHGREVVAQLSVAAVPVVAHARAAPAAARRRRRSGRCGRRAGRSRGRRSRGCSPEPIAPQRRPQRAVRRRRRPRRSPAVPVHDRAPRRRSTSAAACGHLGRDLVAAAADGRPDVGRDDVAPRSRIAATARPTMPPSMPGRPAWTAPTTPAGTSCSSTGTQSATSTASARSVARVTIPSTAGGSPTHGPSTCDDVAAVDLVHEDETLARQVDLVRDGRAVALDVGGVVADVTAEVEAGIRPAPPACRPAGEARSTVRPDAGLAMVVRQ